MSKSTSVRRSAALMSVAAMATTGLIATAGSAGAALTQGGNDATTNAPAYFADSAGIALQLCLDACVEPAEEGEPAPAPADPAASPYFIALASLGGVDVEWGIESTEVVPEDGGAATIEATNFLVVRGRDVLQPGGLYRLRGPWGQMSFRPALNAGQVRTNSFVVESGGEEGSALNGPVQSFLRPVGSSGEMLGDGHAFTRVTGSPTGFNRVTLTGPGINAGTARFALMGQKRADTPMSALSTKALKLGTVTKATRSTANIRLDSFGTADLNVSYTKAGANPAAFQVTDNCAGGDCNVTVSYTPRANRNVSAILVIDDGGLAAPRRVKLTGVAHDTLAPKLASRTPAKGASTVRPAASVKVKYSEAVRGLDRSTFTLVDNQGQKVRAAVSKRRGTFVLNPRQALDRDEKYTVKLNGGARQIHDLAGNAARDAQWSFRTR